VPTFAELGYESLAATSWFALSGPAGLPDEITRRLNAAVIEVLDLPAVRERLAEYPDVPTFAELGYESLAATSWFALSGPAGLPDEITRKLNDAVIKVLDLPAVREKLTRDAIETRAMTPDEFSRFVQAEVDKWGPIAKRVGH